MADQKISELTNITGANLADADEFVVVDVSADQTKAVTRAEFFKDTPPITVTGAVTAGDMFITGPSPILTLIDNDVADQYSVIQNSSGNTFIEGRNGTANGQIIFRGQGGGVTTNFARFNADGNFGIGATDPTQKLEVAGNILMDATDASLRIKSGIAGTTGSVDFTFNTEASSFGSLSLSYDTRASVGLNLKTISSYPVSISSGTGLSSGNSIKLATSGVNRVEVDYLGRVGIGTIPDVALHVNSGAVNNVAKFHSTDSTASIYLTDGSTTGGDAGVQGLIATGDNLEVRGLNSVILATGTTDRLTIDASGNVLVGKTSTTYNTVGSVMYAGGAGQFTVPSNAAMYLNRTSSDGAILQFDKDGTTVGSIGAFSGAAYYGGASGGLMFNGVNINPTNGTATRVDGTNDIGNGAYRFKDLYLSGRASVGYVATSSAGNYSTNHVGVHSGGVTLNAATGTTGYIMSAGSAAMSFNSSGAAIQLGGFGAANKLDDYEEGTWTPTIAFGGASVGVTYALQGGYYTKVGQSVTFSCYFVLSSKGTSTGTAVIKGLPFASYVSAASHTAVSLRPASISFADMMTGYITIGASQVQLTEIANAGPNSNLDNTNFSNTSNLMIAGSYTTAS